LEVEDFRHPTAAKDVMAATNALGESQMHQEFPEVVEANVGVGGPLEHTLQRLRDLAHDAFAPFTGSLRNAICQLALEHS
jgi:hypothetical protein